MHKIDLKALQKELGMSAEGIGRFLQMKNPKGIYNWSKEKSPGTRPSYNAIVRLLQKGATVETLFGVDYAATHQPATEPAENREPIDYQDPKFLETVKKALLEIEERKKQGIK